MIWLIQKHISNNWYLKTISPFSNNRVTMNMICIYIPNSSSRCQWININVYVNDFTRTVHKVIFVRHQSIYIGWTDTIIGWSHGWYSRNPYLWKQQVTNHMCSITWQPIFRRPIFAYILSIKNLYLAVETAAYFEILRPHCATAFGAPWI